MKVLFVSSGNSKFGIVPFVKSQGESLRKTGINLEYFTIKGGGFMGYLKNIFVLKKIMNENRFNLIHAHYSLSAFVTSLASIKTNSKIVVSLMGSDTESNFVEKYLIKFFHKLSWKKLIVKSVTMRQKIGIESAEIISNGVDLDIFKPINKHYARKLLGFDNEKKIILFAADPKRYSKNFELAEKALKLLSNEDIELKIVFNIEQEKVPFFLNGCDTLLLTSRYEGSPNIIKEAMSCNCPTVSTNVGDVEWLIGDEPGHFLASFDHKDVAGKIILALKFAEEKGKTNGRERIKQLGLDASSVANKLISLYKDVLRNVE